MKIKADICLFIILILIMIFIGLMINKNLSKEDKDLQGELAESSQQQNISIFVLPAAPIITIISPKNETYSATSILLNYSIKNEVISIWYNLDNSENITINSSIFFNVVEGPHILYLYANNSYGTSVKNVIFSVIAEINPPSDGNGGTGGSGGKPNAPIIPSNETGPPKIPLNETTPKEIPFNETTQPETPKKIKITFPIYLLLIILLIMIIMILIYKFKKDTEKEKKKS